MLDFISFANIMKLCKFRFDVYFKFIAHKRVSEQGYYNKLKE